MTYEFYDTTRTQFLDKNNDAIHFKDVLKRSDGRLFWVLRDEDYQDILLDLVLMTEERLTQDIAKELIKV